MGWHKLNSYIIVWSQGTEQEVFMADRPVVDQYWVFSYGETVPRHIHTHKGMARGRGRDLPLVLILGVEFHRFSIGKMTL